MQKVEMVLGSEVIRLDDGTIGWRVDSKGLGLGGIERYAQRGPGQTGQSDVGFNLGARHISHTLELVARAGRGVEALQGDLEALLAPTEEPMALRYTRDDGVVRQIACHLETLEYDRQGPAVQRAAVLFKCDTRVFYHPTPLTLTFALSGGAIAGLHVPIAIPTYIGSSYLDSTQTALYEGGWHEYPTMEATGPVRDLVIFNLTTGETLSFAGSTIPAGKTWLIDLRYGKKFVTELDDPDATDPTKLHTRALARGHDLDSWHLDWNKTERRNTGHTDNVLRVTGSDVTGSTALVVRYYRRYTSVYG